MGGDEQRSDFVDWIFGTPYNVEIKQDDFSQNTYDQGSSYCYDPPYQNPAAERVQQDVGVSDHGRISNSSESHGYVENKVKGDGNCQFRAISDQLYQNPESHERVRERIIDQLKSHPEMYKEYVGTDYSDYLNKMSRTGEWGDHVTLQAAADSYGLKISVMTSGSNIEIVPKCGNYKDVINLKFYEEGHYNSMSSR